MRRTDIEAIGELAGEALAAGGGFIKEMHEGIAGRPFGILGPAATPVRVVHDGVSRAVYGGVRGALRGGARGGASLLARRWARTVRRLQRPRPDRWRSARSTAFTATTSPSAATGSHSGWRSAGTARTSS